MNYPKVIAFVLVFLAGLSLRGGIAPGGRC
jgi:hypothetical protein